MTRLDVFRMPDNLGKEYVVDIQADLFSHLRTRIVVPLLPAEGTPPGARVLNPVVDILDVPHVLLPQALASVPARELRRPIGSLLNQHDTILNATDRLLGS